MWCGSGKSWEWKTSPSRIRRSDAVIVSNYLERIVTAAEIDAFFNEPATGPQFEAFLQDYRKHSGQSEAPVSEKTRKDLRERYGRVMVGMRKGIITAEDPWNR